MRKVEDFTFTVTLVHSEAMLIWNSWISVPFDRLSPESRNKKKVDIQSLSPGFKPQQFFLWKICGKMFSPNLWRFVWRRHVGAHEMGTNMTAGNQQKHLSLSFATKG